MCCATALPLTSTLRFFRLLGPTTGSSSELSSSSSSSLSTITTEGAFTGDVFTGEDVVAEALRLAGAEGLRDLAAGAGGKEVAVDFRRPGGADGVGVLPRAQDTRD